jgi:hypothetical protein
MDRLTGDPGSVDSNSQTPSYELIATAFATGNWDPGVVKTLMKRSGEGMRVLAICALIAALSLFPTGRRRSEMPIEIVVLGAAFVERAVTSYLPGPGLLGVASGSVWIFTFAIVLLLARLRVFRPAGLRRRAAA